MNSGCTQTLTTAWANIEKMRKSLVEEERCQNVRIGLQTMSPIQTVAPASAPSTSQSDCRVRENVLAKIENLIEDLMKAIKNQRPPSLVVPNRSSWKDVMFSKTGGLHMDLNKCSKSNIKFEVVASLHKFAMTIKLLSMIYQLVQKGSFATKRDIYYHHKVLFGSQDYVDSLIDMISAMLQVPRWHLHVLATSKGLVAGDLQFTDWDGNHNNVRAMPQGQNMPNHIQGITNIYSNAKFVLVIEKDATFHHLLDNNFLSNMGPSILITGKGVPDVNTRMLIKKLWETLALPTFALVDADPHGMEIMMIYKYGSLAMSYDSSNLCLPNLKWLGLFPSDLKRLHVPQTTSIPLSKADRDKANDILHRPYITEHPEWKKELELILETNVKAELESLNAVSPAYLPNVYIPQKLAMSSWC